MNDAVAEPVPALGRRTNAADAFEDLYRRTFPRVYAYVASLVRDRAAAEDVTAQAFERAYRKRSSFSARRGTPEAWLFGIARNAALDELRRGRRRATLEREPEDLWTAPVDEVAIAAEELATLRSALAALPPRERDLLALKFVAGLSNAEIARLLGISESNAGTRVHRALVRLREACHA